MSLLISIKFLSCVRLIGIISIIAVSAIISAFTYITIRGQESFRFKLHFDVASDLLKTSLRRSIRLSNFAALEITSIYSNRYQGYLWPNITYEQFYQVSKNLLIASPAAEVAFCPLVNISKLQRWEYYATTNDKRVEENIDYSWPISKGIFRINLDSGTRVHDNSINSGSLYPYFKIPKWQVNTNNLYDMSYESVMFNIYSDYSQVDAIDVAMSTKLPALSDIFPIRNNQTISIYFSSLLSPILSNNLDKEVLGFISVTFSWDMVLLWALPHRFRGVDVVIYSPKYILTYSLIGNVVILKGIGDQHDHTFDSYVVKDDIMLSSFIGYKNAMIYSIEIYPTQALQDQFYTLNPMYATIGVALGAIIIIIIFLTYDHIVSKRQSHLSDVTESLTAFADQYVPHTVRERVLRRSRSSRESYILSTPSKLTRLKKIVGEITKNREINQKYYQQQERSSRSSSNCISQLYDNNSNNNNNNNEANTDNAVGRRSRASTGTDDVIADSYDCATVLFADVANFTTWSSTHSPTQVFDLLEKLFAEFDRIAQLRGAYKIETIGDWYNNNIYNNVTYKIIYCNYNLLLLFLIINIIIIILFVVILPSLVYRIV